MQCQIPLVTEYLLTGKNWFIPTTSYEELAKLDQVSQGLAQLSSEYLEGNCSTSLDSCTDASLHGEKNLLLPNWIPTSEGFRPPLDYAPLPASVLPNSSSYVVVGNINIYLRLFFCKVSKSNSLILSLTIICDRHSPDYRLPHECLI